MSGEKEIKVGLLGLGTVGTGVAKLIEGHQEDLIKQTGNRITIKKILVQDKDKKREISIDKQLVTDDPWEVLKDSEIDVIIEVMGNIHPTYEYLMFALEKGKHVVTANKDLMALHGAELLAMASEHHCDLYYEASVAGGIPIIRALVEGFASDRITKVVGIVNGTTNYILSKMSEEGLPFDEVLVKAQELGYAEADPTSDVEGYDAARKMAILSNLAFHMDVNVHDVEVKGITKVTEEDIRFGKQLGYEIKLLGIAKQNDNLLEVSIQPTMVNKHHPLAKVSGVYNAIYVYGEAVGETMFYGPGAGQLPTATAVVSDLVTVIKQMNLGVNGRGVVAPYRPKQLKSDDLITTRYFIRLRVLDQIGVLAKITQHMAEHMISLQEILQLPDTEEQKAQLILITHETSKAQLNKFLALMEKLEIIDQISSVYPVEEGEIA
ncbi:MAG: homoserine dehydrogenase [Tepidibacillus sp.]